MSYICILANENGIAAAGDSRLTLAPIPMHLDHTRKVFSAPEQGLVWACCGMMVWAGINYARWTSHIMRRPWPLERKLEAVARRVGPMLRVCNRVLRRDTLFSLLVGVGTPGAVELVSLDLVNGKSRVRRWRAPAVSEAGWKGRLRPPLPNSLLPLADFRDRNAADAPVVGVHLVNGNDRRLFVLSEHVVQKIRRAFDELPLLVGGHFSLFRDLDVDIRHNKNLLIM